MADHNQKIAAQLQAVSRAVVTMDDAELLAVLMDTCGALLDEVETRRPAVADMDSMDRSEFTIGYKLISDAVGRYAQELRDAEEIPNSEEDPVDIMAELEQVRQKAAAAAARNQELKAELDRNKDELKDLRAFHRVMMEQGTTCTPEIIEKQKKENKQLLQDIAMRQQALEALQNEKGQHSQGLLQVEAQIRQVEAEIGRIPEEQKKLVEEYDAGCARLERLRQAWELYGEDKQAELEKQILELKPVVDKLERQMITLSGQLENFRNSRTELDRENQILRTDLLGCIERAMGELGLAMEEHQQTLDAVRRQADTYRDSLAECERIRGGLVQWLGADRRQLDASLEAIDRQEYTNLRQTLNISAQQQVQDAFSQAGALLEQVDRLLSQCAQAAWKDQTIVKRKAAVR